MPDAVDGYWYIYYDGAYGWSHFEAASATYKKAIPEKELSTNSFVMYPNPTSGILNIVAKRGVASIYNAFGNKVYELDLTYNISEINLAGYPNGIYLIVIENENGIFKQTIIKK